MATDTGIPRGKTAFLEEFLPGNRDSDLDAVNKAWAEAGNEGTLSESLFAKVRGTLGLTTKRATKGPAATGKARSSPKRVKGTRGSKAEEALSQPNGRGDGGGVGKSAFVEDLLSRNPQANPKAINRAWSSAGNEGSISDSVVYKVKRERGAAGETSPHSGAAATADAPRRGGGPSRELHRIEGEIDDLIYRLKGLGGFAEIQDALRTARRLLVRSHGE